MESAWREKRHSRRDLGCFPGRGSRDGAAGKGSRAEAGLGRPPCWRGALEQENRVWRRFVLLHARWVELLGLVHPG